MKKLNFKKTLFFFIKLIIVIIAWYFVYYKLKTDGNFSGLIQTLSSIFKTKYLGFLILLFLMLLNWLLETIKWKYLIAKIEKIKLYKALLYVWAGVSIGSITPNRVGEFIGRVLFLKPENREKASSLTLFADLAQLLITIIFGSFALIILFNKQFAELNYIFHKNLIYVFIIISLIISVGVYLYINIIVQYLKNKKTKFKYISKFYDLPNISPKDRLYLFILSLLRYFVFSFQYFVALKIFGLEISFFSSFLASSAMFLAAHLIPNIATAEAGVRISFAIIFFGLFTNQIHLLSFISILIYFINIAIPIIIGGIFLIIHRKQTKKNEKKMKKFVFY